jgi:hypothetical protein
MPDTRHPSPDTRRRDPLPPLVPLSKVAPQPIPWLSPGRIAAGKITRLDGDPVTGKSTLLCDLAARLSVGAPLPGGEDMPPSPPATVVIMSAEDDPHDTIRPRIDAAGGDPNRVVAFGVLAEQGPGALVHIPDHAALMREIIARLEAALVIIDPLVAFLSPRLNAASDHAVRRALAALKAVAEQTGAAVVAVRHLNKNAGSAGANPLYRGGGSIGLVGAARCALLLAPDPEDPARRILAAAKSNLGPLPPSLAFRLAAAPGVHTARVVWDGESPWTAADLLRSPHTPHHGWSALAEARDWLRAALADGSRLAADVQREAAAAGIARDTLYAARRAEGIRLHKDRTHNGPWSWAPPIPPEVPELPEVLPS